MLRRSFSRLGPALALGIALVAMAAQGPAGAPAPGGAAAAVSASRESVAGAPRAAAVAPRESAAGSPQREAGQAPREAASGAAHPARPDYWSMLFVFALATFIGLGVIRRVSRLLHTPLMSLTNAISAIAVVGAILVVGPEYPAPIRMLGAVALVASMTNIVSGFLITDRMLKLFKTDRGKAGEGARR